MLGDRFRKIWVNGLTWPHSLVENEVSRLLERRLLCIFLHFLTNVDLGTISAATFQGKSRGQKFHFMP